MLNLKWFSTLAQKSTALIVFATLSAGFIESAQAAQTPEPLNSETKETVSTVAQAPPDQIQMSDRAVNSPADPLDAAQVTSVSQLSDVKTTDWAFQALQSLVERYGCLVGYPDRTYRGNRSLSRYEFAAGLNACLNRVNDLIAAGTADLVRQEDLSLLRKLQEEFAAELATLRGRVDALEARTATLEKQQFSTTTKLVGEVIFAITDEFNQPTNNNAVFQDRVRLDFQTSFSGQDTLHTRIAAGNADVFTLKGGGVEGLQTFNFGNTNGNRVYIDWVGYFFPIGEKLQVYVPALAGLQYDYAPTVSSYLESYDGGAGALSIFGQRNPIFLIGGGSGLAMTYTLSSSLSFSAGYLADNSDPDTSASGSLNFAANNPAQKGGLFNGSYSALAQITFTPNDRFGLGLTYINAYRRYAIFDTGSALPSVGTNLANGLIGIDNSPIASTVNAFGLSATYKFSPKFAINGWFSYTNADFVGYQNNGEIWTYALTLAFPDLGGKGNLGGIVAGVEPYLGNPRDFVSQARNNLPIHLEAFYKWQLSDNLSLTPGVIWIVAPGQDSNNQDALIGTVRTTFTF